MSCNVWSLVLRCGNRILRWVNKRVRKGCSVTPYAKQQRLQFESLRHEFLEERRLLTSLFWGGGSGTWISDPSNWYTGSGGSGVQRNWAPGDTAYIQGSSCTIGIGSQVSPFAINFGSSTSSGSYIISG